jgi:hypothetical protein
MVSRHEGKVHAEKHKMCCYYEDCQSQSEPVAHTCNPSYSGGRDQDCGSVPSQQAQIVHKMLSQKYLTQKGLV